MVELKKTSHLEKKAISPKPPAVVEILCIDTSHPSGVSIFENQFPGLRLKVKIL
jgi:hypothetical protein